MKLSKKLIHWNLDGMFRLMLLISDQVNSTEFAESAESAENYNYHSSLIKQPKNYLSTYSDIFSWILSVKNHLNCIFRQFRVFCYGPIPKNENTEIRCFIYNTLLFKITFFIWTFFQTKNWPEKLRLLSENRK